MATTYMTKREAKAMETRIMNTMDSKFNEILEVLKSNQQSADVTVSKKSASKKSEAKPQQTREERLTEKFGDLDTRKKYIDLRNKVASEFKALAEKNGKYIPKRSYVKALKEATDSCNGKLNKTEIKKVYTAYAK